ncbi:Lysozyme S [Pseudolycoriella hygida]|uniref:lysozyme n=1 Tax=Pseudolycoriella hygida TaxID=35572 RepID=A0A9Q0MZK9_9DIPT|nr:Lysozyme S [Pseudolycoriella hygida]
MLEVRCGSVVCLMFLIGMTSARIFDRCDFARTLRYKHKVSLSEINVWSCIAQYQAGFNTEAIGYDNDGTGYYGLFQISDKYWCSVSEQQNNACNVTCSQLLDGDLTDDFKCIKIIYDEHQRLSGNGFNAWTSYKNTCQYVYDGLFTDGCFVGDVDYKSTSTSTTTPSPVIHRVYDRCELARDLLYVHHLPADQIATWVCIAKYESNYNTSAIGSGDFGLFQISNIYWCSPPGVGRACGISCDKLQDGDISDDVECMRRIFDEHERLSGDGFNAWSVYRPHCKGQSERFIDGCFEEISNSLAVLDSRPGVIAPSSHYRKPASSLTLSSKPLDLGDGKIFERCELANELLLKHNIPIDQISTWICIASHASNLNTSAVSIINPDGSTNYGIFQINNSYWCSPSGTGCGTTCLDLQDSDIRDDVECIRKIYDIHQKISGDGFDAWSSYKHHCQESLIDFTGDCFPSEYEKNVINSVESHSIGRRTKAKVYERCELAREMRDIHDIPMNEIPIWVCIAYHESKYDTSAVGRLNADGSADHGIFQISDIYWCSLSGRGKGCSVSCSDLENANITDDVQCIKKIFNEHTHLSGDGFTAWSVYLPYCKGMSSDFVEGCFEDHDNLMDSFSRRPAITSPPITSEKVVIPKAFTEGKVFSQSELASELRDFGFRETEIATWVCIAVHSSSLNTSAVKQNPDGSYGHGIFQISDRHWCSTNDKGNGCEVSCEELKDSNLVDDINCIRKIYDEQRKFYGNGFNAWGVYHSHCKHYPHKYLKNCFEETSTRTTGKISMSTASSSTAKRDYNRPTNKSSLHRTVTPATVPYQFTTKSSTTTKKTHDSSHSLSERERVQSLFEIYFNGFQTPRPTTQKSLLSTTQSPLSNFVEKRNPLEQSPSVLSASSEFISQGPAKRGEVNRNKKGTSSIFGGNVPDTVDTTTISRFATPYTPATVNSKITYQSFSSVPIILSMPHLLDVAPQYKTVKGLHPDAERGKTFVDVEPKTGYPLRGYKRAQFNMFVRKFDEVGATKNFKTFLLPLIWIEEAS